MGNSLRKYGKKNTKKEDTKPYDVVIGYPIYNTDTNQWMFDKFTLTFPANYRYSITKIKEQFRRKVLNINFDEIKVILEHRYGSTELTKQRPYNYGHLTISYKVYFNIKYFDSFHHIVYDTNYSMHKIGVYNFKQDAFYPVINDKITENKVVLSSLILQKAQSPKDNLLIIGYLRNEINVNDIIMIISRYFLSNTFVDIYDHGIITKNNMTPNETFILYKDEGKQFIHYDDIKDDEELMIYIQDCDLWMKQFKDWNKFGAAYFNKGGNDKIFDEIKKIEMKINVNASLIDLEKKTELEIFPLTKEYNESVEYRERVHRGTQINFRLNDIMLGGTTDFQHKDKERKIIDWGVENGSVLQLLTYTEKGS